MMENRLQILTCQVPVPWAIGSHSISQTLAIYQVVSKNLVYVLVNGGTIFHELQLEVQPLVDYSLTIGFDLLNATCHATIVQVEQDK